MLPQSHTPPSDKSVGAESGCGEREGVSHCLHHLTFSEPCDPFLPPRPSFMRLQTCDITRSFLSSQNVHRNSDRNLYLLGGLLNKTICFLEGRAMFYSCLMVLIQSISRNKYGKKMPSCCIQLTHTPLLTNEETREERGGGICLRSHSQ